MICVFPLFLETSNWWSWVMVIGCYLKKTGHFPSIPEKKHGSNHLKFNSKSKVRPWKELPKPKRHPPDPSSSNQRTISFSGAFAVLSQPRWLKWNFWELIQGALGNVQRSSHGFWDGVEKAVKKWDGWKKRSLKLIRGFNIIYIYKNIFIINIL